jgi:hypothetical protein
MTKVKLTASIIAVGSLFLLSCDLSKDTKSTDYQIGEINSVPRKTYEIGKINILDFLDKPFTELKAKYDKKELTDNDLTWIELDNNDAILNSSFKYSFTFLNHNNAFNSNIQEISVFIDIPLNDFSKQSFEDTDLYLINHIEDFNLLKAQLDNYRSVSVMLNTDNVKLSKIWFMKHRDYVTVAIQISIFDSIF